MKEHRSLTLPYLGMVANLTAPTEQGAKEANWVIARKYGRLANAYR